MDKATIGAAYTGLKFAKDALEVALGYKIETETRTQISAALEKLGAAQDTLCVRTVPTDRYYTLQRTGGSRCSPPAAERAR